MNRPPVALWSASGNVDAGLLVIRVWFGSVMAVAHGLGKVVDLGRFIDNVARRGFPVPEFFGTAAALSEFVGGILLALGLLARPAAVSIALTMLVAAFYIHASDPFQKKEFALAYAISALAIAVAGPGRYSLDWLIQRRRQR
jgi:putative oxidoreductase